MVNLTAIKTNERFREPKGRGKIGIILKNEAIKKEYQTAVVGAAFLIKDSKNQM